MGLSFLGNSIKSEINNKMLKILSIFIIVSLAIYIGPFTILLPHQCKQIYGSGRILQ